MLITNEFIMHRQLPGHVAMAKVKPAAMTASLPPWLLSATCRMISAAMHRTVCSLANSKVPSSGNSSAAHHVAVGKLLMLTS